MAKTITAPLIIVTRHAEKPDGTNEGVDATGATDPHSLIVRGWQRSGAMVHAFAPTTGKPAAPLATPAYVIAATYHKGVGTEDPSLREGETISAVAEALGLTVNTSLAVGQEKEAADLAMAQAGVVLLCWDHKMILPELVSHLPTDGAAAIPGKWPKERFDMFLVFTLNQATGKYSFEQVPQLLLPGDSATLFATS